MHLSSTIRMAKGASWKTLWHLHCEQELEWTVASLKQVGKLEKISLVFAKCCWFSYYVQPSQYVKCLYSLPVLKEYVYYCLYLWASCYRAPPFLWQPCRPFSYRFLRVLHLLRILTSLTPCHIHDFFFLNSDLKFTSSCCYQ